MAPGKPLGIAVLAYLLATVSLAEPSPPPEAAAARAALGQLQQETRIAKVLEAMKSTAPYGVLVIQNVRIIDPITAQVTPGQSVVVYNARIGWVGDQAQAPAPKNAAIIDGKGRFLSPGLTDMHIHSTSASGWLLNLAAGVTTVRDMDGLPWILEARNNINAGKMLGPTEYVAGTIIASAPLAGYAVVAANSEDARRIVRQQESCAGSPPARGKRGEVVAP